MAADKDFNPMGTRGFEFVEFTGPDVSALTRVFQSLGFAPVAMHRSKNVTLFRQGGINFILNGEGKGFPKDFRDQHGPSVCAIAIRVDDAPKAMARAQELGAKALINEPGPMELALPGIEAIGGSRIFFIDRYDDTGSIYDIDFKPIKGADQHPEGAGLVEIDHLTNNVYRGRMDHWAQFYETLFNFREIRYFDIEGKLTGLKSRAMTSPDGKIRIPINESSDDKSQIEEYLREYKGEGIQHIAMSTTNIYETVRRLRASNVELMAPPPETYYEMLAERLPGHGEDVAKLKELGILLDGSPSGGLLLQIFTQTMVGPIFFEIIQRKGDEGFGEGNFRALFESIERDQVKRGVLKDSAAKEIGSMSRMEKKSSEPSFTVATTSHELRGDYSTAAADYTIQQDWSQYTEAEHALWRKLYQRQAALMPKYAAKVVQDSLDELDFSQAIPNLDKVSHKLQAATGWRLVAVPGFIPDTAFFAHLAERRFPVTIWLRKPEEIDYLVEPDIFHDFFGHVPLLFDPVFADFLQLYGVKGQEADRLGMTQYLARLYWYTVEFGLIREGGKMKAFGAGILSSFTETSFCVDDPSPNRIAFDLERVMNTLYRIDDFQETYFALESFADLFAALKQDLRPIYERVKALPDHAPDDVLCRDCIYWRGTGAWKKRKQAG